MILFPRKNLFLNLMSLVSGFLMSVLILVYILFHYQYSSLNILMNGQRKLWVAHGPRTTSIFCCCPLYCSYFCTEVSQSRCPCFQEFLPSQWIHFLSLSSLGLIGALAGMNRYICLHSNAISAISKGFEHFI